MKLAELEHADEYVLQPKSLIYRVQRSRARPGTLAVGPLRLPPAGMLLSRFDLPDDAVGYFAGSSETAAYESLARRDMPYLSIATASTKSLLTLMTTAPLRLLDLRLDACEWPVLQSARYAINQALALAARDAGYDGLIYRSAQQDSADCIAVFGRAAMRRMRLVRKERLVHRTGAPHQLVEFAVRRSGIPPVP